MAKEKSNPANANHQGWLQFLNTKTEMLNAFDKAKGDDSAHKTHTHRGRVAEAVFREWLSNFLPQKYGVTSGYIVPQTLTPDTGLPHFDVIIYDKLESPVLWIESHPDLSSSGRSKGIPSEYVRAVIEVKSSFNSRNVSKAVTHLLELSPLLADEDAPNERYKKYLCPNFFCSTVFFELRKKDEKNFVALKKFIGIMNLRGFSDGLILRGEGLPENSSGRLIRLKSLDKEPIKPQKGKSMLGGINSIPIEENLAWGLLWMETDFSMFAFDLLATLNGTYMPGMLSSLYAFGASNMAIAE